MSLGPMTRLSGISVDFLFWLRNKVVPVRHDPATSPAVVVAIDEETFHTPPFADIPNALWTREIASVLNALVAADVKVVGFDAIFPASVERFVPGFDRDFLIALHNAAKEGKVVLGEAQHQRFPIHPFPAQSFAVGNEKNIRSTNLFTDDDEVIRRIPLMFERENPQGGTRAEPSMALELAARAAGAAPTATRLGGLALGSYEIPGAERNTMMVNFDGGDAIPSYSLADLQVCAAGGNAAFFREHFGGKVVLIGGVLDVEDRKLTSMRFITAPDHPSSGARCALPPMRDLFRSDLVRDSIPGVFVLATAVDNLLRRDGLIELAPLTNYMLLLLLTMGGAVATMALRPLAAGGWLFAGSLLWVGIATFAFAHDVVIPLAAPPLGAALATAILLGYRFAVTDKDRRLLRSSFGLYLAPALVDRMLESDRQPELGGELRNVTVLFSDLAGFTNLSEHLAPSELVALMNTYLTAMTDIIESEGGFVDKFVGDAISAVFGAPLDDSKHAEHAVRAALRCRERLVALNRDTADFGGHELRARIGLGTGEALVGNIGSRRRFNYTAMGDIVNLAARLEGANKTYGTAILAAEPTRVAAGDAIEWREIDRVRVVGRDRAVSIFEPLAVAGAMSAEKSRLSTAFSSALAAYRARQFETAAGLFEELAANDTPSRIFVERARRLSAAPPAQSWDAIAVLESK
jgi:adenylate cyclase